jgi:glucosamine kinase
MKSNLKFIIGVDGGGSGTRVLLSHPENLKPLASAEGAPSALGLGIEKAWRSIMKTIAQAFANANLKVPMLSECGIGLGLSGANNIVWKNEFLLRNPGFKTIVLDTDGYTTLLGAHGGKPGVIVAVGTGSVAMRLSSNGERKDSSGWGFPSGDEASGAWLGLKACALTQKALDGRRANSPLTQSVLHNCGQTPDEFLRWLGDAQQTAFASLAPLIFQTAISDPESKLLLTKAGLEIAEMVHALDPKAELPLSICGRLGEALIDFLPTEIKRRHQKALGESTMGALHLIAEQLK